MEVEPIESEEEKSRKSVISQQVPVDDDEDDDRPPMSKRVSYTVCLKNEKNRFLFQVKDVYDEFCSFRIYLFFFQYFDRELLRQQKLSDLVYFGKINKE